ncbi:hypothetical protein AAMO2058_000678400 [Amorphochlora amoebiformis]
MLRWLLAIAAIALPWEARGAVSIPRLMYFRHAGPKFSSQHTFPSRTQPFHYSGLGRAWRHSKLAKTSPINVRGNSADYRFVASLSTGDLKRWLHEAGFDIHDVVERDHLQQKALEILHKRREVENTSNLPAGWTEYRDPAGRPYYYYAPLNLTTWTPPRQRNSIDLEEAGEGMLRVLETAGKGIAKLDPKLATTALDHVAGRIEDLKVPRLLSPVTGGLALGLNLTSGILEKSVETGSHLIQHISDTTQEPPKSLKPRDSMSEETRIISRESPLNFAVPGVLPSPLGVVGGGIGKVRGQAKNWISTNLRTDNPPQNQNTKEGPTEQSSMTTGEEPTREGWDLVVSKLQRLGQNPMIKKLAGDSNFRLFACVLFILGFSAMVKSLTTVLPQAIIVTVVIIAYRLLGSGPNNVPQPNRNSYGNGVLSSSTGAGNSASV